jgi:hypothetical protein
VSRNQHSGREEHASQEEVGYLTSIHYFLWRCNFYGGLLFTNIAFLLKIVYSCAVSSWFSEPCPFTRHEAGATIYIELLEREQFEIRIVAHGGAYAKAIYSAHEQTLTEKHLKRITSRLPQIDKQTDTDGK